MGNQVSYSGDLSFDMSTPPTPFNQPTPGGLQFGKVMFVEGETLTGVNGQADRFNVNFHTSPNDTLLHYDVRFWPKDTAIIINSRHQGTWQKEERLQNTIPKNRLFRIDVQITPTGFIITQDQMRPYTFNYRHGQTPDKIRNISIEGNIKIKRVFYGYPGVLNPQPHQQQQPPPPYQSTQTYAPSNPSYQQPQPAYQPPTYQMPSYQMPQPVPNYQASSYPSSPPTAAYGNYSAAPSAPGFSSSPYPQANTGVGNQPKWIQGGMSNGRQIIIQGTPRVNSDRFAVDLNGPVGTIALHLSIRFSEQAFVRNSMRSNTWENEERYISVFPFVRNQPFEIQILSDVSGYKNAVNGRHTADFFHRMDAQLVQSVSVTGDVSVIDVRVF